MKAQHQDRRRRLGRLVADLEARADFHDVLAFDWSGAAARTRSEAPAVGSGSDGRSSAFRRSAGLLWAATSTSTVMPRSSPGKPIQVPWSGMAWAGSRAM